MTAIKFKKERITKWTDLKVGQRYHDVINKISFSINHINIRSARLSIGSYLYPSDLSIWDIREVVQND